jgi:hypothetical protein
MSKTDPIFVAIETHRLADAAWDDALQRKAEEDIKDARQTEESATMLALLRTRPETAVGALAVLRYIADYCVRNDTGLFHGWNTLGTAGTDFLPMIADVIEAQSGGKI